MADLRTETMTVNMGPQHPSTHGVLRLVLELDGETVVSVSPTIGFLHTGIEKTAEQKKWQQVIPLVERMDYLGAQSNSLAFALSVERMLGIDGKMPERVNAIRVLIAELQRISSHLVWFGTHAMEIGSITGMLYAFREREILMNLNEMLAGFRFFPSYIRVGGLREDLPRGFKEAVTAFLDRFPGKLDEYETLITKNPIWLDRTRGVGVITLEDCYKWGLYGPIARAAGGDYGVGHPGPRRQRHQAGAGHRSRDGAAADRTGPGVRRATRGPARRVPRRCIRSDRRRHCRQRSRLLGRRRHGSRDRGQLVSSGPVRSRTR